jgi:uncharacterized integral membrane protein
LNSAPQKTWRVVSAHALALALAVIFIMIWPASSRLWLRWHSAAALPLTLIGVALALLIPMTMGMFSVIGIGC